MRITAKKTAYLLRRSLSAVVAAVAGSAIFTVPKQYLLAVLAMPRWVFTPRWPLRR